MRKTLPGLLIGSIACVGSILAAAPAIAESMEFQEKPALYTYVSDWQMPRGKWTDFEKPNAAIDKMMGQAISSGSLVGYGTDKTEVHSAEGPTHDNFWSAMSMAGILDVLDSIGKGTPDPLLQSASKHSDAIYVSRYYNWKAGTYKGAYTHTSYYKIKESAPDDVVEVLSKHFIMPVMEKLLAEGSIIEYEVDRQALHTGSADGLWVTYITPNAAALDKVAASTRDAFKANAFIGQALGSAFDNDSHRDYLYRSNVTYK